MSVEIRNVSKSFTSLGRKHVVFKDLNLSIPRGLNLGIIGPNGAGKSTLLRMIAGADHPDTGHIVRNMNLSWPIGFTGFATGTGLTNARFCARLYGRDPDEVVQFTTEFSGLGKFMHWPVKTYSSGMRSRLGFSLSMAIEFDCLLIDEVLAVGDADFRKKSYQALADRKARCSVIIASHNLKEVGRICDRVLVIEPGRKPIISDDVAKITKYYSLKFGQSGPNQLDE